MFRLMRPSSHERYIHHGRLFCPVRGRHIDVDRCAGCDWLSAIDRYAEPAFVRCQPEPIPAWVMRILG